MRRARVAALLVIAVVVAAGGGALPNPSGSARVVFNDNTMPAGSLRRGVLRLELEIRQAAWHLLGPEKASVPILAFAERGRAPTIPGPLIRVPVGTTVHVTLANPLSDTLVVHGLSARRVVTMDSIVVPPGATQEVRFRADVEGTYYYWGTTTKQPMPERRFEDSQLAGALIVDPPSRERTTADRIFILGSYYDGRDEQGEGDGTREFLVINGRPWPYTERLTHELGDSIRWRIINPSPKVHPMHLHGFYYRVDARGDFARDSIFWPGERRIAVTERMDPGSTMTMVWSPDRPGGWLFHCHLNFHVVANPKLGEEAEDRPTRIQHVLQGDPHHEAGRHVEQGMGGLILLTRVSAPPGYTADAPTRRRLRLFVQSDSSAADSSRRFAYVLQEGDVEPRPDSVRLPGSLLLLERGEPTSIVVINRSPEPTQIHWHGIELESYFDGAVGVGGTDGLHTPVIMAGDSFEVRMTPPRSGSFMYHTHVNEIRQQGRGLYGALVVVEDRKTWDASRDLVYLAGGGGFGPLALFPPSAEPVELMVGTTYRLRLMNVTLVGAFLQYRLTVDGAPARWTPVAKDGHDLPSGQRLPVPSQHTVSIGETYDVEITPSRPGEMWLELRAGGGRLVGRHMLRVVGSPPAR